MQLELAVLEDRIKYANPNEFPVEKQSAIITGKVQDAILKKEAALAIRQTFIQIIDIMKKVSMNNFRVEHQFFAGIDQKSYKRVVMLLPNT